MANKSKRLNKGIVLVPNTDPILEEGEIKVDSVDNKVKVHSGAADHEIVTNDQAQNLTNKTLDDATTEIIDNVDASKKFGVELGGATTATKTTLAASQTANVTVTLPDATDTLVGKATVDTLTNKTLTSPVINTPSISDPTSLTVKDANFTIQDEIDITKQVKIQASGITTGTTRTLTVPDADDTIVGKATTDTLTNKTLTSPIITTPVTTGGTLTGTDIDGGVATNISRITVPKDTIANLTALTRKAGTILFATDDGKPYYDDGVELRPVSSGGGTSIEITQAAHGLALFDAVYHNGTTWVKAKSDVATTLAQFVVTNVKDINTFVAHQFGQVNSVAHGLTVGQYYFLSNVTSGLATVTEPISGYSAPLFYVMDVDNIIVNVYRPAAISPTSSISDNSDVNAVGAVVDDSLVYDGAVWLPSKNVKMNAGTIDASVISTTDIDGGVATDTSRITMPKETKANLDALTRKAGTVVYGTDTKKLYNDDGTSLNEIGGSGGGLDTFHTENFEGSIKAASFTTGNNAAFLGAGAFNGTLLDETIAPLSKTSSLKYTMGATATNDYFSSPVVTIDDKQAGNTNGMTFYYTYNGNDNDIKIIVYDVTGAKVVTQSIDYLKAASNPTRFSVQFPVDVNVASLRYGFQVVTGNVGKILVVDDIELTSNPFVSKNLLTQESYRIDGHSGYGSTNTVIPYFTTERTNTMSSIGTIENSVTNGLSFTALKKCTVTISYTVRVDTGGNDWAGLSLNSTQLTTNINTINVANRLMSTFIGTATASGTVSWSGVLESGDTLRPHHESAFVPNDLAASIITITAQAESEHIIAYNSRNAANLVVEGAGNAGTVLTASVTNIDFTETRDTGYGGANWSGSLFTAPAEGIYSFSGMVYLSANVAIAIYSYKNSASVSLVGLQGSATRYHNFSGTIYLAKGDTLSFRSASNVTLSNNTVHNISITKIGVGDLLGVPKRQVAYIKDVKASGTDGGTSVIGIQTRTLNTLTGDTSFVSLNSNQITLEAGKYKVHATVPTYSSNRTQATIYNISTSSDEIIGVGVFANSPTAVATNCLIDGAINITSTTVFEVRHYCQNALTSLGLGVSSASAASEVYTQVIIEKLY